MSDHTGGTCTCDPRWNPPSAAGCALHSHPTRTPEQPSVDWLDPARESCLIDGVRYEKRWMAWHPRDGDARIKATEESAKRIADQWNGAYGKDSETVVCRILVPARRPAPVEEEATE